MAREKLIPVVVPEHLKGLVSKDARALLRESRKRNALNKEHIAHITLQEVTHPDGSVSLVPLVVAKPPPTGVYRGTVWPHIKSAPHHQYFTD